VASYKFQKYKDFEKRAVEGRAMDVDEDLQFSSANIRARGDDQDDFDVTVVFNTLRKMHLAVGRTMFLELKPENCFYGTVREGTCPVCRRGWRAHARLRDLSSYHSNCSARHPHALGKCPRVVPLLDTAEEVASLDAAVVAYAAHRRNVSAQSESFRKSLEDLASNQVLLLFDFSPYKKTYDKDRTLAEAFNAVQSLHICAYFGTGNKGEPPQLTYYDYFANENNDYFYFRHAMLDLTARPEFQDKVITEFWSDGGPKHFKTKRAILFAIVELPLRRNWAIWPKWNFFVAHHGKSMCDAHASHCKSLFRRLSIAGRSLSDARCRHVKQPGYVAKVAGRTLCFV